MEFNETINTGTTAGDKTGDGIRTNMRKLIANDNVLKKVVDDLKDSQVTGFYTERNLADLPNPGTQNISYKVTNDNTSSDKNGYYSWNGSSYVKDANLVNGEVASGNVDAVSGDVVKTYADHNLEIESLSINKFDVSKSITGYTINQGSISSGKPAINANGRISGLVPVLPNTTYILYGFTSFTDKSFVLSYEGGANPLNTQGATLNLVRGGSGADWYNFTTLNNTKYIQFSHGTQIDRDITKTVVAVGGNSASNKLPFEPFIPFINKVGYWENIPLAEIGEQILRKINKSGNLFFKDKIITGFRIDPNGTIAGQVDKSILSYTEIEENQDYVLYDFDLLQSRTIAFYDNDKDFISSVVLSNGGDYDTYIPSNTILDQKLVKLITSPANAKYIQFTFHTNASFENKIDTFKFFKRKDYAVVFADTERGRFESTYEDIVNLIHINTKSLVNITLQNVLVLGDSMSLNNLGFGGWCDQFTSLLKPKKWLRYAEGGATLTDVSLTFGSGYIANGENSLIQQLEKYLFDYDAGDVEKADILLINGGVNDYDKGVLRYVTDSDLDNENYDEYMETNFFTNALNASYGNYTLKSLSQVNRAKAIGALRYIVERLLEVLPNVKIFVITPIQTTNNNFLNQKRFVDELKYACNRLSIPVIDQWGKGQTPLLSWDYPVSSNSRYLPDGTHDYDTEAGDVHGRFIVNEFIKQYQFFDTTF